MNCAIPDRRHNEGGSPNLIDARTRGSFGTTAMLGPLCQKFALLLERAPHAKLDVRYREPSQRTFLPVKVTLQINANDLRAAMHPSLIVGV